MDHEHIGHFLDVWYKHTELQVSCAILIESHPIDLVVLSAYIY